MAQNHEDQKQEYREEIARMLEDITGLDDLRRIYTLVSVKYEKYEGR